MTGTSKNDWNVTSIRNCSLSSGPQELLKREADMELQIKIRKKPFVASSLHTGSHNDLTELHNLEEVGTISTPYDGWGPNLRDERSNDRSQEPRACSILTEKQCPQPLFTGRWQTQPLTPSVGILTLQTHRTEWNVSTAKKSKTGLWSSLPGRLGPWAAPWSRTWSEARKEGLWPRRNFSF